MVHQKKTFILHPIKEIAVGETGAFLMFFNQNVATTVVLCFFAAACFGMHLGAGSGTSLQNLTGNIFDGNADALKNKVTLCCIA